jgi:hypothetical protein
MLAKTLAHLHDKVPPSLLSLGTLHLVLVELGQRLDAVELGEGLLEVLHDGVIHPEFGTKSEFVSVSLPEETKKVSLGELQA